MVEVEITKRSREYGYVYWFKEQDKDMQELLGKKDYVELVFLNAEHGSKRVDWGNRRISIGYRWTRRLPDSKKFFVLKLSQTNRLEIQCR